MKLIDLVPLVLTAATGPAGAVVVSVIALIVVGFAVSKIPAGRR